MSSAEVAGFTVTLGEIVVALVTLYYLTLDPPLALLMLAASAACLWIGRGMPPLLSLGLFVGAWVLQFVGHYVYAMQWSPDGSELMMNRTNRRQQILELIACNPSTTKCRVIVHEEWPTGWVDNRPQMRYLADRKRFIWESDRTGLVGASPH